MKYITYRGYPTARVPKYPKYAFKNGKRYYLPDAIADDLIANCAGFTLSTNQTKKPGTKR